MEISFFFSNFSADYNSYTKRTTYYIIENECTLLRLYNE